MKKVIIILIACCSFLYSNAQTDSPKEVTPELLKKIKSDVEVESSALKATLDTNTYSLSFIEFIADTFKVQQVASKMMEIDYSTYGINNALDEMVKGYDVLLNKYYNKFLSKLKGEDKNILIESQRKWIAFRDSELHLLGVLSKEEYSGGGTIQSNILGASYSDRIINRVIELFYMYDNMLK
jgi:uncharacterized protein YecT (DUF1311 family)